MPLKRDARTDLIGTDAAKTSIAASGSTSAQIDVKGEKRGSWCFDQTNGFWRST